jgi:hypothetical protein
MFYHLGLQATTTDTSSYIICQSYRKTYHCQSDHECAPAHFSRAVRDVLNNTYHHRWTGRGGPTAWPPRSPDMNPLDFYLWGHLKPLVYSAPVDNEEALRHCIVDACQAIRNCPGIFERMWWSMTRRRGVH